MESRGAPTGASAVISDADVVWRPLTVGDAAGVARLDRATLAVDDRDDPLSVAEVLEGFEPSWARPAERSIAAVAPGGDLLAVGWIHLWPGSARARTTFLLHPSIRGDVIPERLLEALSVRARELADRGAAPDGATLEIEAQPQQTDLVALLERAGFHVARRYHELSRELALPLAAPVPPQGIVLHRWAERWSEGTRRAHNEAFADHWGSSPLDEETWRHRFGGGTFRPDLSFVAVAAEEVVGYLLADVWEQDWPVKGFRDAWIGTLGTRPGWRGRGVASALLLASMQRMRGAGMEVASLGVDSQSPTGADRLYAQHGFTLRRVRLSYGRPLTA